MIKQRKTITVVRASVTARTIVTSWTSFSLISNSWESSAVEDMMCQVDAHVEAWCIIAGGNQELKRSELSVPRTRFPL
jgi:hypothetical protein